MDRELISQLSHADHPINSPLDDESVRRLLRRTVERGNERVLDLGCGEAAWLLRTLAAHPKVTAEGVDNAAQLLAKARQEAADLGVEQRLVLHHQDATEFTSPAPSTQCSASVPPTHSAVSCPPSTPPSSTSPPTVASWSAMPIGSASPPTPPAKCSANTRTWRPPWTASSPTAGPCLRAHQHTSGTRRLRMVLDRISGNLGAGPPRAPRQRRGPRRCHHPPLAMAAQLPRQLRLHHPCPSPNPRVTTTSATGSERCAAANRGNQPAADSTCHQ